MVRRRRYDRTTFIQRLVAAVLLYAATSPVLYGQGVELSLSNTRLREGQELLVQIEVDYPTPEEVELRSDLAVDKLVLVAGPTTRTLRGLRFSDQLRTMIQLEYRATTAGRSILPVFEIAVAGQDFATEPRLLEIVDPDVESDLVPPDLAWRASSLRVYEGEAVGIFLSLRNLTDFTFPDELSVANPSSGLFQEVQGIGSVERTTVDDTELLSIPIATFIFTPSQPGEVAIPAAGMRIGPFTRRSDPLTIVVDPLPERVAATGAVGQYDYEVWASTDRVRLGDGVEITMHVEGEGNLDFFRFPAVDVEDAIQIGSTEESRFAPSELGYVGYRRHIVELSLQREGVFEIDPPEFAWVNPRTRRVHGDPGDPILVTVEGATGEPVETLPAAEMVPLSADEVSAMERPRLFDTWTSYLLLLPGPLVFLGGFLWRRRRRILPAVFIVASVLSLNAEAHVDLVSAGVSAIDEGRYLEAVDRFQTALLQRPYSPGLYYNLAVVYQRLDEPAYTVYNLRRAVEERPLEPRFRDALRHVEVSLDMQGQLEPGQLLHPDSYFAAGVVFFNLLFLVIAIRRLPRGGRIILGTLFLLLSVASFSVLAYRVTLGDRTIAVVGPGAGPLRRIPDVESSPWMSLPATTPVEIVKRMPPLVLVRTAYGVEGWISETSVLDGDFGG